MSFPIRDLPLLPVAEVLKQMDLIELITFCTLCQGASKLLTRKYRISLNIELIEDSVVMYLRSPNGTTVSCHTVDVRELRFKGGLKYCETNVDTVFEKFPKSGSITTFWVDRITGVEVLFNHFLNIFPHIIVSIDCASQTHLSTILNVLEARKPNLEKVQIESNPIDKKLYKHILDVCGNAKSLHLLVETKKKDSKKITLESPLSFHHLHVSDGDWVTVENLKMFLNCIKVNIQKTKLTSQNLNSFLKKWREQSNLKSLYIASTEISIEEVMEGLEATSEGCGKQRGRMTTYGFTIQQMNGMKASVRIQNKGFIELVILGDL